MGVCYNKNMELKTLLYALLTMVLWGTAPLLSKVGLEKVPPFPAMLMRNLMLVILALGSVMFSAKFRSYFVDFPKQAIFIIIAGTISGLIGQYTYYMALKSGQTSQVVPIASSFPLMTALLSILILNEPLTLNKGAGVILILSGIFLISY